jgi:hypothetical protein
VPHEVGWEKQLLRNGKRSHAVNARGFRWWPWIQMVAVDSDGGRGFRWWPWIQMVAVDSDGGRAVALPTWRDGTHSFKSLILSRRKHRRPGQRMKSLVRESGGNARVDLCWVPHLEKVASKGCGSLRLLLWEMRSNLSRSSSLVHAVL